MVLANLMEKTSKAKNLMEKTSKAKIRARTLKTQVLLT
jgi:hypothetical protein